VIARNIHFHERPQRRPVPRGPTALPSRHPVESEVVGTSAGRSRAGGRGRPVRGRGRRDDSSSTRFAEIKLEDPAKLLLRPLQEKGDPPDRRLRIEHPRRRPNLRGHEPGSRRCRCGKGIPGGTLLTGLNIRFFHLPPREPDLRHSPSSEHFPREARREGRSPGGARSRRRDAAPGCGTRGPGTSENSSSVVDAAVVLAEGGVIGPGELPLETAGGARNAVPAKAFDLPPQRGGSSRRSRSTCCGRR